MKNKVLLRIFAISFSLFLLVSCFVIAPSADTYDDNLTHYWLYFSVDHGEPYMPGDSSSAQFSFDAPFYQKCSFIYFRLPNGQNLFTSRTFKKLSIYILSYYDEEGGYSTRDFILFFDVANMLDSTVNTPQLHFQYQWDDSEEYLGLTIYGRNLHPDYPSVEYQWLPSYGNYNLQLWLDSNYVTNIYSSGSFNFVDSFNSLCRYSIISHGKTYTEGYNKGFDFGLEEGYGNGYDQGNIDGIQQGITDGYNNGYDVGFQDGLDDGYFVGFDDGRMDGIEDGYRDGYDDAKAVYDTTEAWQDMKSLIFAIFDAPFYVISYSLDFNLFGINVAGTLIALISTALIVWLLKIIIVKFF